MKKSNIIIITTSAILLLLITGFFIAARIYAGKFNETDKVNKFIINKSDYSVIWLENSLHINLKQGEKSIIEVTKTDKGNVINGVFEVKNDTLFIRSSDEKIDVFFKNANSIICHNSKDIVLINIQSDTLDVNMNNSEVVLSEKSDLEKLKLKTQNSTFRIYNDASIKSISLQSDNSTSKIYSGDNYQNIEIEMKNNSEVSFYNSVQSKNLRCTKDGTSKLKMY